jgi:hypothetical protein
MRNGFQPWPKVDVSRCSNIRLQEPALLDHLVGEREQRYWDFEAEFLCRS